MDSAAGLGPLYLVAARDAPPLHACTLRNGSAATCPTTSLGPPNDARYDRVATLKPKLLLLRGLDDPGRPPEYEKEMHETVPGSRYVRLSGVGHFPPTESPDKVNALIEEFVAAL